MGSGRSKVSSEAKEDAEVRDAVEIEVALASSAVPAHSFVVMKVMVSLRMEAELGSSLPAPVGPRLVDAIVAWEAR